MKAVNQNSSEEEDEFIQKPLSIQDPLPEMKDKSQQQISCLWKVLIVSWIVMMVMASVIAYLSNVIYTSHVVNDISSIESGGAILPIDIDSRKCFAPGTACDVCCGELECVSGVCCAQQGESCSDEVPCCDGAPPCLGGICTVPGRPYNIVHQKDLRSSLEYSDAQCDYELLKEEKNQKYLDALLSEHASIATFNKFSIELMNLGAPLWLSELAQEAAVDEIRHAKIMMRILNSLLRNNNMNDTASHHDEGSSACAENIGRFPNHNIEIDGDCNRVALDVVNGGCFGETMASIHTMREAQDYKELHSVAMDEVRHSALAWVSAKWMIHHCENINIAQHEWWKKKLTQTPIIIRKLFKTFWNFQGRDYRVLYRLIHDMLAEEVSVEEVSVVLQN